ncbi:DNA-entry nuclease [Paenibacillus sp. SYP-B3998]|uniref:DNA-entry nuclease n=1 Tax=Paenibacillus sp. SYP-B3998 TaxID=2678564 RepID=A0A6G3ZV13_9BACL|nr:NucA/NucB deoxyribonuclease domain-containing protein [Paenibacillus sp. SYP-B3998]NEW05982.1 DNA-entry nuclease [Paenibacillus sp. SYP-B3998]
MRKSTKKILWFLVVVILIAGASYASGTDIFKSSTSKTHPGSVATIVFPSDRYPETAAHIKSAIAHGESAVCTINREGAEQNRGESLKGIPTKKGYDRDEWPMAMCAEGGTGADIRYVTPADNRGAGSWISNQLEKYPNGTKVEVVVK